MEEERLGRIANNSHDMKTSPQWIGRETGSYSQQQPRHENQPSRFHHQCRHSTAESANARCDRHDSSTPHDRRRGRLLPAKPTRTSSLTMMYASIHLSVHPTVHRFCSYPLPRYARTARNLRGRNIADTVIGEYSRRMKSTWLMLDWRC